MAHKVFINYRRGDSKGAAGRIFDRLEEVFGKGNVFLDVEDIPPGMPYVEYLKSQIPSYDIFLVLIGPNWLNATDARGRHLGDPDDPITVEIVAALESKSRVIPITIDDARMPTEEQLPEPLKRLAGLHAVDIRDTHFRSDIDSLIKRTDSRGRRRWIKFAGAGAALLLVWLIVAIWPRSESNPGSDTDSPPPKQTDLGPSKPPPPREPVFTITNNRDLQGQDIAVKGVPGLSMDACASKCANDSVCVAFSYDRWNGVCFTKRALTVSNLDPHSVIGVKRSLQMVPSASQAPVKVFRRPNHRFPGQPIATTKVTDLTACQAACEGDARCVAFTFLKGAGQAANCQRFDNPDRQYEDDPLADSGWKAQEQ